MYAKNQLSCQIIATGVYQTLLVCTSKVIAANYNTKQGLNWALFISSDYYQNENKGKLFLGLLTKTTELWIVLVAYIKWKG